MEQQKNYLSHKKQKKKSAQKVVWIILALAIFFIVIIAKIALSGEDNEVNTLLSGMPSSAEVYNISKQFVLPTLKGSGATFSEDGYEYGKKADSVFVIRSVAETKTSGGELLKTNFEITLKYKGGIVSDENSWEVLNLDED